MGSNSINATSPPNINGNILCSQVYNSAGGLSPITVQCNNPYGIHGRYVSVQAMGTDVFLTLCEVQVFGPAPWNPTALPPAPPPSPPPPTGMLELALGKRAYQVSTHVNGTGASAISNSATLAVDGWVHCIFNNCVVFFANAKNAGNFAEHFTSLLAQHVTSASYTVHSCAGCLTSVGLPRPNSHAILTTLHAQNT